MTDPNNQNSPPRTLQDDMQLELYKMRIIGTKEYLAGALRVSVTLNGGAAVAILAFLGSVWGDRADGVPNVGVTMFLFLFGLALGGLAYVGIFAGQWRAMCLQRDGKIPEHDGWLTLYRIASISLLVISVIFFVFGAWTGSNALNVAST